MKIDGCVCVLAALAILILPLNWLLAGLAAAGVHELCHYLAVKAAGGRVWGFRVGVGGAVMEAAPMSAGKELLCVLAGPMGGILLTLCFRWIPRTAICAGLQSAFNLLPVMPLDGGRAVGCIAKLLPGVSRDAVGRLQGWLAVGITSAAVLAALILRIPALILPFLPIAREIFLAKSRKKGYNSVTLK